MIRRWTMTVAAMVAMVMMAMAALPALLGATQGQADGRDVDRAAIRAHIEKICQAFLDGDTPTIHATHTEDWRGFLENSRTPIKGIDAYMRANGIPWPQPTPAAARTTGARDPNRAFNVFDFDVHFYTSDLAVVNFFVDFGSRVGTEFKTGTRYRIMDIYARRLGEWNQAASHTVVDPTWRNEQMSQPGTLPPVVKQQLLEAREAVWRAYFTNDQVALAKLVPADTIVLQGNPDKPFIRQPDILEGARRGAERGMKLIRLEFPQTEVQVYGLTAIIYTTYLYELESPQGQKQTSTGAATEIFVRRGNAWVNPGWHMAGAPAK